MHLLLFPLLPLLLVPLFVAAMMVFVVGAVLFRILFFIAIAAMAGAFLLGGGLFRACASGPRQHCWRHPNRRFDEPPRRDPGNSAFDDYRRATLNRLEDEAREFRTFLAKLRQAADAADFQAFLKSRRAGGS